MRIIKNKDSGWHIIRNGDTIVRYNGTRIWLDFDTLLRDVVESNKSDIWYENSQLLDDNFEFETVCEFNDFADLKVQYAEYFI